MRHLPPAKSEREQHIVVVIPRRCPVRMPGTRCPPCRGIGVRFRVGSVSGLPWNGWPLSSGISVRFGLEYVVYASPVVFVDPSTPPRTQDSIRVGSYPLPDGDFHPARCSELCSARNGINLSPNRHQVRWLDDQGEAVVAPESAIAAMQGAEGRTWRKSCRDICQAARRRNERKPTVV